jgi:tRNA(Ile)-lysidine synthetase-like protein
MSIKFNLDTTNLYVLAVSGGIDSMVLFDLFLKHKYKFVVVHFNHQKRKESIHDHQLIEYLCHRHLIPYHYIKLNIKNGNFQESSRNARILNLEEIADSYKTKYIVTAHHLDDLAETVLMKLMRGSNLLGYSAMQEVAQINQYTYLKPLLNYSKSDIQNYQKAHDLKYLEDHTNLEDTYLRNRIRHHIIPILKDENDVLNHFKNFSHQSYLAADYIRTQSKQFLNLDLSFKLDEFNLLHDAIKMDIISLVFETLSIDKTFKKIKTILKQLASNKPNISITLSKDFNMIKAYNLVYIEQSHKKSDETNVNRLMISHNKVDLQKNWVELCYNKLDFPIQLRHRLNGDKLSFTFGRKKLKDLLIDKKIPLTERSKLKIIVDSSGTILWIPGLYLNETLGKEHKIYLSIKE